MPIVCSCPACGSNTNKIINTKQANKFNQKTIRRLKECLDCGEHFTTYEVPSNTFKYIDVMVEYLQTRIKLQRLEHEIHTA